MSILGMNGFESYTFTGGTSTARSAAAVLTDKITTLGGTITHSDSILPSGSPSQACLVLTIGDIASMPWWDDAGGSRNEPAGTYWFHAQVRPSGNTAQNDNTRYGTGSNDTEFITLSTEDSTANLTLRIGSSVVATSSFSMPTTSFTRLMVEFAFTGGTPTNGDTIKVYKDGIITGGSEIISYTLTAGDQTTLSGIGSGKANGFWARGGVSAYLDDMWAMDTSVATGATDPAQFKDGGIRGAVATGDGTPTGWTPSSGGTSFDDIDVVTDADYLQANATAVETRVTKDSIALQAERVGAVKVYSSVTQSDVTAGTQIGLGFTDGVTTTQKDSLVPGAGYVTNIYDERSAGVDWTPSNYDGAAIKIISVA